MVSLLSLAGETSGKPHGAPPPYQRGWLSCLSYNVVVWITRPLTEGKKRKVNGSCPETALSATNTLYSVGVVIGVAHSITAMLSTTK